ncbi:MAG: type 4a pilus biogenesis protein PilO [Candidatus Omnitrophica bacterium]|nr:type 4a pilus biogenesis protein PilO [Candidatus Omnitrophota bacterium]
MIDLKNNILKNQKLLLYITIGACLFFADFYMILKPVAAGLIKTIPNVSAKASQVNIMKIDVNNIPAYEGQIKNMEGKLSNYKRKFSTKEEISPLLKNLSDTAKAYDVKIVSVNPAESLSSDASDSDGAYRKFPIYLNAVSGYHSFGLFLNKLENTDTFMRVGDLKIIGDITGSGNHKFDVIIVTYILTPREETEDAQAKPSKQAKLVKKKVK